MKKTPAVSYLRVSTDLQVERGMGLDVQRDAIDSWAREQKRRIVQECADEGISGAADVLERPGLAEGLRALADGRAEELVVLRMDRLARDLVLQEWLRSEVLRAGCQLRSVSPTEDRYLREDPTDPTGRLVRQILGSVAEYERAMVRLRMRAGLERKREAGGFIGGRPPYGWRSERGDLVPVVGEQEALKAARLLRDRGYSWRRVAHDLEVASYRTRKGTPWTPYGISRAVENAAARKTKRRNSAAAIETKGKGQTIGRIINLDA